MTSAQNAESDNNETQPISVAIDKNTKDRADADKTEAKDREARKAEAEARKAEAEARKAEAEAVLATFNANAGEVTLKEKAGSIEAALLATKAVTTAAKLIYAELPGYVEPREPKQKTNKKKTILLYSASEIPNFQAIIVFKAQIALVEKAFNDAKVAEKNLSIAAPIGIGALPGVAAAALDLDAVIKLAGFFRTDYTVGGVDLMLEDSLLVHALAGLIADSDMNFDVQLPAAYSPGVLLDANSSLLKKLTTLASLKTDAQEKASQYDELSEGAGKKTNDAKMAKVKYVADIWRNAIRLYDSFFNTLTTIDDKGVAPLTDVIREWVVAEALKDNFLLLVKLQKSGGEYYTKKNIWTLFGGMPFFHMGGVVASFVLLDGNMGTVCKSGIVPVHGGFVSATDLQQKINK